MVSHEVHAGRYHRFGNSRAIILPKRVREALMLQPEDLMLMSVYGSLLIMRRVDKRDVVDVSTLPTEALPPGSVSQVRDAD